MGSLASVTQAVDRSRRLARRSCWRPCAPDRSAVLVVALIANGDAPDRGSRKSRTGLGNAHTYRGDHNLPRGISGLAVDRRTVRSASAAFCSPGNIGTISRPFEHGCRADAAPPEPSHLGDRSRGTIRYQVRQTGRKCATIIAHALSEDAGELVSMSAIEALGAAIASARPRPCRPSDDKRCDRTSIRAEVAASS